MDPKYIQSHHWPQSKPNHLKASAKVSILLQCLRYTGWPLREPANKIQTFYPPKKTTLERTLLRNRIFISYFSNSRCLSSSCEVWRKRRGFWGGLGGSITTSQGTLGKSRKKNITWLYEIHLGGAELLTHTHIINAEIQLNLAMLVRKCYIHQKEISPWERAHDPMIPKEES